jgi:Zn-dependent protease with chaperone function
MKSVFAIIAFVIVYLVLFALALGLVVVCFWAGVGLIANSPGTMTFILGGGLMGVGVLVFFFLIKFLFDVNKRDTSGTIEVTAADQPELVAMVHAIADEAQAPKPKKIFISHDVNASVFYNSSFWSMFLPVRKNLMIGLGLVNALNKSELQAVIAHEFGHFSQRSMKLGSFVYHVNHIIYNMLYRNDGFGKGIQTFSQVHFIFYLFARITIWIIQGIQFVLRQMYKLVNLSYMGLSRQMEFHADLVAANVSGSNNIISALQRIETADHCYHATLEGYNKLIKQEKVASDFYADHQTVLHHFVQAHEEIKGEEAVQPRVNIKDQWASHPTTPERKAYLDQFDLSGPVDPEPAWSLFSNPGQLKQELTRFFYRDIPGVEQKTALQPADFADFYQAEQRNYALPKVFGRYYDNRSVKPFDLAEARMLPATASFPDLFSPVARQLPAAILGLKNDIAVLKAIEGKELDTRSFDFDGTKYKRSEAARIGEMLEAELAVKETALVESDKNLFSYFEKCLQASSTERAAAYATGMTEYFAWQEKSAVYLVLLQDILAQMGEIFAGQTVEIDRIQATLRNFKEKPEKDLKAGLNEWLVAGAFDKDPAFKEKVASFIVKEYPYFGSNSFLDNELTHLHAVLHESWAEVNEFLFDQNKRLLGMQADCLSVA